MPNQPTLTAATAAKMTATQIPPALTAPAAAAATATASQTMQHQAATAALLLLLLLLPMLLLLLLLLLHLACLLWALVAGGKLLGLQMTVMRLLLC
jgi:hypothetical protein